ncbi:MAG: DUF4936 family protein [Burkholderiaceae bacterium]
MNNETHAATSGGLLYIYYKVPVARHAELAREVTRLQATLLEMWPGLACGLLQRPQATDGIETWMETYRHPSAAIDALAASIEQTASAHPELPLPRHAEIFIAVTHGD